LANPSKVHIKNQSCSAKTGEGLLAGLQWLSEQLIYKKNNRFPNNPYLAKGNFND